MQPAQIEELRERVRQNVEAVRAYEMYLELSPNALDKNDIRGQISRLGG